MQDTMTGPGSPFGLVVPGSPCTTSFTHVAENRWVCHVSTASPQQRTGGTHLGPAAAPPRELLVFLLPNAPQIPHNMGVAIYLASSNSNVAPQQQPNFEYLGSLLPNSPSTLIHVPAGFDTTASAPSASLSSSFAQQQPQQQQQQQQPYDLICGLALESLDTLANLNQGLHAAEQKSTLQSVQMAQFLAGNLHQYLDSFAKPLPPEMTGGQQYIAVPANTLDRWLKKTADRLQLDPFFWKRDRDRS